MVSVCEIETLVHKDHNQKEALKIFDKTKLPLRISIHHSHFTSLTVS